MYEGLYVVESRVPVLRTYRASPCSTRRLLLGRRTYLSLRRRRGKGNGKGKGFPALSIVSVAPSVLPLPLSDWPSPGTVAIASVPGEMKCITTSDPMLTMYMSAPKQDVVSIWDAIPFGSDRIGKVRGREDEERGA
jgi:hypothetical protein